MMYPRLKILSELLKDGGVIFISIDDYHCELLYRLVFVCSDHGPPQRR